MISQEGPLQPFGVSVLSACFPASMMVRALPVLQFYRMTCSFWPLPGTESRENCTELWGAALCKLPLVVQTVLLVCSCCV